MTRGRFITFEGIDGSGKSTQARRLAEALRARGDDVVLTREPGGAPGAEDIRRLLVEGDPDRWSPETEILLFTAARRDHLENTIQPALDRGATVISDRFADSTRVYQGAARGDLRDLVDRLHDMMIAREPELEKWSAENGGMPPGLNNPLGARALYIFQDGQDTLYHIHGSPEYWTIGKAVSSGCVRLMNQDVIDLYDRVPPGSRIVVV